MLNINYIRKLDKKISLIYRNYTAKVNIVQLIKIRDICREKKQEFYLSNNINLAIKLKLNGIYIPSFNKKIIKKKIPDKNFIILGSAHNVHEIKIKERQGAQIIFLSPLFKSTTKNKALGINKFNILRSYTKKKVVALGGINENNIKKLKMTNTCGFASISYIKKKFNLLTNKYL